MLVFLANVATGSLAVLFFPLQSGIQTRSFDFAFLLRV